MSTNRGCEASFSRIAAALATAALLLLPACGRSGAPPAAGTDARADAAEAPPGRIDGDSVAGLEEAFARLGAAEDAGDARRRAWLRLADGSGESVLRRAAEIGADASLPAVARRGALQFLTALAGEGASSAGTVGRILDDADPALARSAAAALGRMGGPGLDALVAATGPSRPHGAHVAAAGALRWSRLPGPAAEAALVRMLTQCGPGDGLVPARRDRPERWTVSAPAADVAALGATDDDLVECRRAAAEALGAVGVTEPATIGALVRALSCGEPSLSEAAAAALAAGGDAGALELAGLLAEPRHREQRRAMVAALAGSRSDLPEVRRALVAAAADPATALHALRGLARVPSREAAATFVGHLADPAGTHRVLAIDALSEFGTFAAPAVPILREIAESGQPHAAGRAVRALDRLGALTLADAQRLLASAHPDVRTAAARRVVRGAPPEQVLPLLDDAADPRCLAAVDETAARPDEFRAAMPALARLARASGGALGWAAAGALGRMGPEAGPVLAGIAGDPGHARLPAVLDALVATRWPQAGHEVVRALRDRRDVHGGQFVESGLAPRGAGPDLVQVLRAPDDDGRHRHLAAAVGLLRIGEPLDADTERRVVAALTRDWAFVRSRRVEVLGLLARFGPKAKDALPRLRYAARVVEEDPVRTALRDAIRAIERDDEEGRQAR